MNPLAVVLIGLGLVIMIIGFKDKQDTLISAIKGGTAPATVSNSLPYLPPTS